MKTALFYASILTLLLEFCPASLSQAAAAPGWLQYLGDGADGAYSCTGGKCILGGEHWFTSFNVSPGATVVTTAGNNTIVIRSIGACTIGGTISNSVNTAGGGGISSLGGDFGGGGGGGGGGANSGKAGNYSVGDGNLPIENGGAGGSSGGANGGAGITADTGQYHSLLAGGTFWAVGGSVGGQGGGNGSNYASGGNGGVGGGPVLLVCESIHFTGKIDVSGGAGSPAPANNTGAGGGGGAGYVIFSALTYTANTGTINLSGGPGGGCGSHSGCGKGGAGGDGWNVAMTIH